MEKVCLLSKYFLYFLWRQGRCPQTSIVKASVSIGKTSFMKKSVPTRLLNLKKPLIAKLLEKEEVSYLVFKGFHLYTNDFKTLHKSYPEIVWNRDYKQIQIIPYSPYMVMDVLDEVWSRINDDVFRELMGYLS